MSDTDFENIDSSNDENIEEEQTSNTEDESTEELASSNDEADETLDYKKLFQQEQGKNKQIYARLKKLEGKTTTTSTQTEQKPTKENILSRDEARLIARGLSDDEIEDVKFIASRKNISLDEAMNTREYKNAKKTRDDETEIRKATLGASNSTNTRQKKTFSDKELSRDDHKKLFDSYSEK